MLEKSKAATFEERITPLKSLEIPIRNQKSRTPVPEISLKIEKSRTLNVEVIYPSIFVGRAARWRSDLKAWFLVCVHRYYQICNRA